MADQRKSTDEIVASVKSNKYLAPVLAVAVIVLAVLTYVVEFTSKFKEVTNEFSSNHEQDMEAASYRLGVAVANRIEQQALTDSTGFPQARVDYARDMVAQSVQDVGFELDRLGLKMQYADLDYSGGIGLLISFRISHAYELIQEGVESLHQEKLLLYYQLGAKLQMMWLDGYLKVYDTANPIVFSHDIRKTIAAMAKEEPPPADTDYYAHGLFSLMTFNDVDKTNQQLAKLNLSSIALTRSDTAPLSLSEAVMQAIRRKQNEIEAHFHKASDAPAS